MSDPNRKHPSVGSVPTRSVDASGEVTGSVDAAPESPAPPASGSVTPAAPPPGYEFVRELGRGGFGTVWLARHLALEKHVAIKHMRPERVGTAATGDLVREARTMAALKVHPNR